ncbi:MAG TPA: protein kinase [Gaiellaceae bacterium]|nr:protein kinase [Gaiellaceae bacterium]
MPEVGTQFAGYRLEGVVGRGGMGVVYRATELALERPVALKLIAPELAGDDSFRERFLRESRLAASIDHAGILPVYAAGEADGELFLATRFVPGTDLRSLIDDEPLPGERAIGLVGQVADALDAAHERGLVHRDVKPGNVLVDTADHCYLCDFGLTTQRVDGGTTATGRLAGSLDYLAPEQIRQGDVDGRADQYALACVLYEVLSGAPPFRRETEAQTLWAHMQEEPAPLLAYDELDPVFARALAKEPEERYEDCNAFADDARAVLGLGPSPIAVSRRRRRIGGRLLAIGAALLAAAVTAVVLALTLRPDATLDATPNSVGAVDPASLELTSVTSVGNTPTDVAASDEWVWVINSNDGAGTISRIDARSRTLASTFSVAGTPRSIVAAFGSLWVGTTEGRVHRVEPGTDLVESSWTLPNAGESTAFEEDVGAGWLAAAPNAVWAGSSRALTRIDPTTSRMSPHASSTWGPMAYGSGSLWVLGRQLVRVSTVTARVVGTVDLIGGRADVATGFGSVWIADDEQGAVVRVDMRQEAIERTYDVGGNTLGIAASPGGVWAASDDGTVVRIDPETHDVTSVRVGGAPRVVDVGAGEVWVSVD